MRAKQILKSLGATLGIGLSLAAIGAAYRLRENGRVRVRSEQQAIEMAKAQAGPSVAGLPFRVEAEQDYWIVRFGPDGKGLTHSYLVTLWDKQAGPLDGETTVTLR